MVDWEPTSLLYNLELCLLALIASDFPIAHDPALPLSVSVLAAAHLPV